MAMNIKKGDTIVVLSGKDKGKQGKVLGTVPKSTKIVAEGINMVTCHVKPRRQGEEGGIVKREAAIAACKVQVVCPKCSKATRVAYKIEDGKKSRVCKHCGGKLSTSLVIYDIYGGVGVELYCPRCEKNDFGVEPEVYALAEYFVQNFQFNYFLDMEENDLNEQLNIAKIADILSWLLKSLDLLDSCGLKQQPPDYRHLKALQ